MRIVHISDTHNLHHRLADLAEADVIVHSGDFTMAGSTDEVVDFINWFSDLPYAHKIFIAGNHDMCLYDATISGLVKGCHYLCNSAVEIDGVRFYGVPMFMEEAMNGQIEQHIRKIPAETDVLITHQPPFGILDFSDNYHYGNKLLLQRVESISPRLHLFGHIHNAYGTLRQRDTLFSNAALLGDDYELHASPVLLDI